LIDTLIAFGCSFTYGDELRDPSLAPEEHCCVPSNDEYRNRHCYAGIVADHYNLKFVNTAEPGGTLESMQYSLYWASQNLDLEKCLLVAGITEPGRKSYFDQHQNGIPWIKHRHSTWLRTTPQDEWSNLDKLWTSLCHCEEWEKFNLFQTLQTFESIGAPLVFLPVFEPTFDWNHKNKTDFVLQSWLSDSDFAPHGHPNENGHQKIAQRLIKYIDRVKLIG